ncbi:MAG: hypothetical protein K6A72_08760, partial [Lachnospiraceae bacterium]|nr:hypothetical protein [Lachnospiraceae bacterium]
MDLQKNGKELNEEQIKGQEFKQEEKKEITVGPDLNVEINKNKQELLQDQEEVSSDQLKETVLNKEEMEFIQGNGELDLTKMGQGMNLTMLNRDFSEATMRANVKNILGQYLEIRKKVLDGKGENDLSNDERFELGTVYERLVRSVDEYVAVHGEQAVHGKAAKNLKRMARIKELIHMDNRFFMLSENRRKKMESLDARNEGDSGFPTFLKALHAADSISIRNQIYKDSLKKQTSIQSAGWWKTAMKNNWDRTKIIYNVTGGLIDRAIGVGTMIASNTVILGGKVAKLPLKLLSMAFNALFKKYKSKKRWTVDYSITKGWAGLSESRQIFRDCAKGLVALPVGVYDSFVHGFPYLFRKMTGKSKKSDKVYRASGKLFKGIGKRITNIMSGLGFNKHYIDLKEIDEAELLDKTVMDSAEELDVTLHKADKEKVKEGKKGSKEKKIRENQLELEGLFGELGEKEEEESEEKVTEKNEEKEEEKEEKKDKDQDKTGEKEEEKKEDDKAGEKEEEKEEEKKEDDKTEEKEEEKNGEKNGEKEEDKEKNDKKEEEENKDDHALSPEEELEKKGIYADTIMEFKAVYNAEAKKNHEEALKKLKERIPYDKESVTKIIQKHQGWIKVKNKEGEEIDRIDWKVGTDKELIRHLKWLEKYYIVHDPTSEVNRKSALKRIEMGNYTVSMKEIGMDEAYENQGPRNCYACSATAMLNQYIAHHRKAKKGEKKDQDRKVVRLYRQYDLRDYEPNIRLYDPKLIMEKGEYDGNVRNVAQYAGKGKDAIGNVFALGDFILDKLSDNGIKDAMLNRMLFTVPVNSAKDEKEVKERNEIKVHNMQAVFSKRISDIISSGGVASVLTVKGHYAHYITITGINGDNLDVYDSNYYSGQKKVVSINSIIQPGQYTELNWISQKDPKELTKEFKGLKYDEKDGYTVELTTLNQVSESITHTKGVTVVKDVTDMVDEYEDIAHMAYIPDEKKIESLPLKDYLKEIEKKGKKNADDKTVLRDKGWVVFSDAEESQEYTEEEFKEKIEEKKAEDEEDKEKNTDEKK